MGKNLSVLILGGTGIIGRELSRVLVAKGHDVFVVSRGARRVEDGTEPIVADVYDTEDLQGKIEGLNLDVVVDLVSFNPTQLERMLGIFDCRCGQYMFVSSATVYDGSGDEVITEATPFITDGWSYPMAKIACERLLRTTANRTGQVYTIVRPYITYSEQRLSFGIWEMPDVWWRIQGDIPVVIGNETANTQTTLTHAEDLALGMTALMGNEKAYDEDFHITSGENMSWGEVYEMASDVATKDLKISKASVVELSAAFPELAGKIGDRSMSRIFDNSKLHQACPGLIMKHTVKDDYKILASGADNVVSITDCLTQGRMDRFIKSRTRDKRMRRVLVENKRNFNRGRSLKFRAAYAVGLHAPWLLPYVQKARSILRSRTSNNYAA